MPMLRTYAYSIRARLVALRARLWSCVFGWFERVTSVFDSTRESASEMTPAATSGVDCVLGGSELQPGAALYRCGPAIAQQKRHRPECGHTVKGARCYRLCAHSLVRQSEPAKVGIRRSTVPHRGTVVSTSLRGTRSPQTSRRVAKRTAGAGDIIEVIMISCLCLNRLDSSNE